MKYLTIVMALSMSLWASGAEARGTIERACLKADRSAATRALCACIQDVADPRFSRSEQRRIAKFFRDPHLSQELRQSDRRSDRPFWDAYKAWGAAARRQCG